MATITTQQGDTWDKLSKKIYGNELYMDVLINANIKHRKTLVFSAGVKLEVPEIDTTNASTVDALPIWKRSKL